MLRIETTKRFEKDLTKALCRGFDLNDYNEVIRYLVNEKPLPDKHKNHPLVDSKDYKNARECHIKPN